MLSLILFDLDDTLYHASNPMGRQIIRRMTEYVARHFVMTYEEARSFRHGRSKKYGTTLEWLMAEHGFADVEDYFAAVHPEDEIDCLAEDPVLAHVLDALPQRKAVLTNSPSEHALRVLKKLGVADRFEAIYDIRFGELVGKPHAEIYLKACKASGAELGETLFVDDLPKYVRGFLDVGGRALLLDELDRFTCEDLPSIKSLEELPQFVAGG